MGLEQLSISNDPVEMKIIGRDGTPILSADGGVMSFMVLGMDSDKLKKFNRADTNRKIKKMSTSRGKTSVTAEEMEGHVIERAVQAIADWKNIERDGEPVPYSEVNVRTLLTDLPDLLEQVDGFISDRNNFFKG
jgi:hypothetical protein